MLSRWTPFFKGQRLNTIEATQINQILQEWQEEGKANATLMRLRSVLMSLFKYRAPDMTNPVLKAMSFKIPKARARAIPLDQIAAIFGKAPRCETKARQMMIFYFGARPSEIMRLRSQDIVLTGDQPHIFIRSCDAETDGKGTNDRIMPIVSEAQREAAQLFIDLAAWGRYSTAAARTSFLRWAKAAGLGDDDLIEGESRRGTKRFRIRIYDLRHTFATELRKVADLSDVAAALGHRSLKTSERYAPTQDAKIADSLRRSAIHHVPVNTQALVAAMSQEQRQALLAELQRA